MSDDTLHSFIYNDLLKKIMNNEFLENEKLPSEPELQSYYGASRTTVRRAVQDLQDNGYVEKFRGKGTLVKNKKTTLDLQKLDSFTNEFESKGMETVSVLLHFEEIIPNDKVKLSLNLGKNEQVYYIERLRKVFDLGIGVQKSYVVKKLGIQLQKEQFNDHASLYEMISQSGVQLFTAVEDIEAKMPTDEIKEILDLGENMPIFYRERITYDANNLPVEYCEMFYRSDEYKYKIKLQLSMD